MKRDEKKLEALLKRPLSDEAVELLATIIDRKMVICRSSTVGHTTLHLQSLVGEGSFHHAS